MMNPFELDRPMYFILAMASLGVYFITEEITFAFWFLVFFGVYIFTVHSLMKSIKRQARIEFREDRIEMLKHEGITHQLNKVIELLEKPKVKKPGKKK